MDNYQSATFMSFLERRLTPERLAHSVGVMRVIQDLAEIYGLDPNTAATAGLLHDAAKDISVESQLSLVRQAGLAFAHPCEKLPIYLHAPASAFLIATELGITDRLVLDAIAAHSYSVDGPNSDSLVAWCLRSADLLAPVKEWNGMQKLKSVVYAGKIQDAALLQCRWLLEYLNERNIPAHPILTNKFESLFARLQVDDSFFERW